MRAVAAKRSRTLPVIGATLVALCTGAGAHRDRHAEQGND